MTDSKEYEEGRKAYVNNHIDDNPYLPFDQAYYRWNEGWWDAHYVALHSAPSQPPG